CNFRRTPNQTVSAVRKRAHGAERTTCLWLWSFQLAKIALMSPGANMIELAQNGESPELSDAFEKLAQEAARLQTVIDTVPSFLWTSLPDGSKEYLNKRWYEYTGLSLEEGKGWGWKVVVHPDDLDR